jgi:hypothetical protein
MSAPGHLEKQVRGLVDRIRAMEKELRQKDRVIGNLISTQDNIAKCLRTITETQATMQRTQDATIAAGNANTETINAMGCAVAHLMKMHHEHEEVSVH